MFGFDITLKMAMGEEQMNGSLIKHYNNRSYPFRAEYGKPRYDIVEEEDPIQVGKRWDMTINVGKGESILQLGCLNRPETGLQELY